MTRDETQGGIEERIAALSPEKQALVRARLGRRDAASPDEAVDVVSQHMPLTIGQYALWLDHQLRAGPAYNILYPFRIEGPLEETVLRRSIDGVVARHEGLRTTINVVDDQPVQTVHAAAPVGLEFLDLADCPSAEQQERCDALAVEQGRKLFDLERGPLVRWTLVRRSAEDHLVLVVFHHIAVDAWSWGILLYEVSRFYAAHREGRTPGFAALPLQYGGYAQMQRARLDSLVVDERVTYWKTKLDGSPPTLDLPADRARPPQSSHFGERVGLAVPRGIVDGIRRVAVQGSATPFMVMLGALKVLLSRYCNSTDIVVGSAFVDRGTPEQASLIGYLMNVLVLRTDLAGDPTFHDLLQRVKQTAVEAYANCEVPYDQLVAAVGPMRDPGRNTLYQVQFEMLPMALSPLKAADVVIKPDDHEPGTVMTDLDITVYEIDDLFEVSAQYSVDLFDGRTIERLLEHYVQLISSAVTAPGQPISRLGILADTERTRILSEWNATTTDDPRDQCVHQLVMQQCERVAQKVAVSADGQRLTYSELAAKSGAVAAALRDQGVGPGSVIAICVDRSIVLPVALLGILRSGAAYLPLDPDYPLDRLTSMLDDSRVALAITDAMGGEVLGDRIAQLRIEDVAVPDEPGSEEVVGAPGDLAYVIYTSASTGPPKGVPVHHGAVVNFLAAMAREPGLGEEDVVLSLTTIGFDISVLELLLPLVVGAQVVIAGRQTTRDPNAIAADLQASGVTVMQATPSTWSMLVESGWAGDPSLKVLSGGEAIRPDLARRLVASCGEVWNMYGPTETTIWSTCCRLEEVEDTVSVGRPIANTRVYILDEHHEPVPVGVSGELLIGGDGVARGYLNRDDLTARQFVADPFDHSPDARLYRTGDLARFRADGRLDIVGRIDNQLKIRGHRVEPGEIEDRLCDHPLVLESVVVGRALQGDDLQLVAYVVFEKGQSPEPKEVRAWVCDRLPAVMVPGVIMPLAAFPLTPAGKVDRKALPDPEAARAVAASDPRPRTEMEERLLLAWRDVLMVPDIEWSSDFFGLGGDSMMAMRVANRLTTELGKTVPILLIFDNSVFEDMAAAVDEWLHAAGGVASASVAIGQARSRR